MQVYLNRYNIFFLYQVPTKITRAEGNWRKFNTFFKLLSSRFSSFFKDQLSFFGITSLGNIMNIKIIYLLLFCESNEHVSFKGCGFITRLGCTRPRWCIGNWCMAKPPCSDITMRTPPIFTDPLTIVAHRLRWLGRRRTLGSRHSTRRSPTSADRFPPLCTVSTDTLHPGWWKTPRAVSSNTHLLPMSGFNCLSRWRRSGEFGVNDYFLFRPHQWGHAFSSGIFFVRIGEFHR